MQLCCTLLSQKVWKAIRGKNTRLTHLKFAVQIFFQQFGHFTRLNFLDGTILQSDPKKKFTLTFWDWPIVKLSQYLYTTIRNLAHCYLKMKVYQSILKDELNFQKFWPDAVPVKRKQYLQVIINLSYYESNLERCIHVNIIDIAAIIQKMNDRYSKVQYCIEVVYKTYTYYIHHSKQFLTSKNVVQVLLSYTMGPDGNWSQNNSNCTSKYSSCTTTTYYLSVWMYI